jgi:hypothetical protein
MIRQLFELGQASAAHWLGHHLDAIGHNTTVDIRRDYLDDTREEVPPLTRSRTPPHGFRPWLARLFRRGRTR